MALGTGDRQACNIALQRFFSQAALSVGITKAELQAAINAVDDWCDTNATSYNTALPQPARGSLSTPQKTLLLAYVCMRRAGVLRIAEDG